MMPVSSASSPLDTAGSIATAMRMRSGTALCTGQRVSSISGSATTIIAAEITGRVCHAIEIAPAYVDVAVKRWQEFTGQQAVLEWRFCRQVYGRRRADLFRLSRGA